MLTSARATRGYTRGFRYGSGPVAAVVRPGSLVEQWRVLTAAIAYALKPLGWRVSDEDEKVGIDEAEHAETAYESA